MLALELRLLLADALLVREDDLVVHEQVELVVRDLRDELLVLLRQVLDVVLDNLQLVVLLAQLDQLVVLQLLEPVERLAQRVDVRVERLRRDGLRRRAAHARLEAAEVAREVRAQAVDRAQQIGQRRRAEVRVQALRQRRAELLDLLEQPEVRRLEGLVPTRVVVREAYRLRRTAPRRLLAQLRALLL